MKRTQIKRFPIADTALENLEPEARWRLVETAWDMNLPKHLVQIEHDDRGDFGCK